MIKKMFLGLGTTVILAAIFANQLGIDNDAGWGRGRIGLLYFGLVLVSAGLIQHFFGAKISLYVSRVNTSIENTFSRPTQLLIMTMAASIFVLGCYFWFIRLDERVAWSGYEYYVSLAKSFKMGRLSLEVNPPPELLAMDNPYDYLLRRELGVDNFPWDLSLYRDKFYVYWGPVPAILLTPLSHKQLDHIGDFHLVLFFACGVFIYLTLILVKFWRESLRHTPVWLLGVLILIMGLITPATITLKDARIYEAAILSCQFFFIGGIYWGYKALSKENPSIWMLAFASLHWALAFGSRIIILPASLFCAFLTIFHLYKNFGFRNFKALALPGTVILFPLIIGGIGQAIYNWMRFDSIFEFGLKYQLANIDYTSFNLIFTLQRIPENLYIYFLSPIKLLPKFPFLSRIEYLRSNERMAGLLYISPFIILSILPLVRFIRDFLPKKPDSSGDIPMKPSQNWLVQAALGSGLLLLLTILSYYFIAMRFIEDFMPALILASTIQIGKTYESYQEKPSVQRGLVVLVLVLSGITIAANFLLATPPSGVAFMLNLLNSISKILGLR